MLRRDLLQPRTHEPRPLRSAVLDALLVRLGIQIVVDRLRPRLLGTLPISRRRIRVERGLDELPSGLTARLFRPNRSLIGGRLIERCTNPIGRWWRSERLLHDTGDVLDLAFQRIPAIRQFRPLVLGAHRLKDDQVLDRSDHAQAVAALLLLELLVELERLRGRP